VYSDGGLRVYRVEIDDSVDPYESEEGLRLVE